MTFRVFARGSKGEIRIRDYESEDTLLVRYIKIGTEDCSTDLALRGLPVLAGLIGPMPDGEGLARYETPEVFEKLTKEWSAHRRRRKRSLYAG